MALNKKGQEIPDPQPVEVPLRFRGQSESLHEKILRYIRSEQFRQKADSEGFDTEEEANDFEVDDDEGSDLPISQAEAAIMIAEELQVAKKELVDMEGKLVYNKNKEVVNEDRLGEGGSKDRDGSAEGVHEDVGAADVEARAAPGGKGRGGKQHKRGKAGV